MRFELISLFFICLLFIGAMYYYNTYVKKDKEEEENQIYVEKEKNSYDNFLMFSIGMVVFAFFIGMIFSQAFIVWLYKMPKFTSIALLLQNIKGKFVSTGDKIKTQQSIPKPSVIKEQRGGCVMSDDDFPIESDYDSDSIDNISVD